MLIRASDNPKLHTRVKKIVELVGSGNRAAKLFKIGRPSLVQYIANQPVHDGTVALLAVRVDGVEKEAVKIAEATKKTLAARKAAEST